MVFIPGIRTIKIISDVFHYHYTNLIVTVSSVHIQHEPLTASVFMQYIFCCPVIQLQVSNSLISSAMMA